MLDTVGVSVAVIPSLDPSFTVSDHILTAVLALIKKEVSEHGRHIAQYFHLFLSYSNLGIPEVSRALKHVCPPSHYCFTDVLNSIVHCGLSTSASSNDQQKCGNVIKMYILTLYRYSNSITLGVITVNR